MNLDTALHNLDCLLYAKPNPLGEMPQNLRRFEGDFLTIECDDVKLSEDQKDRICDIVQEALATIINWDPKKETHANPIFPYVQPYVVELRRFDEGVEALNEYFAQDKEAKSTLSKVLTDTKIPTEQREGFFTSMGCDGATDRISHVKDLLACYRGKIKLLNKDAAALHMTPEDLATFFADHDSANKAMHQKVPSPKLIRRRHNIRDMAKLLKETLYIIDRQHLDAWLKKIGFTEEFPKLPTGPGVIESPLWNIRAMADAVERALGSRIRWTSRERLEIPVKWNSSHALNA